MSEIGKGALALRGGRPSAGGPATGAATRSPAVTPRSRATDEFEAPRVGGRGTPGPVLAAATTAVADLATELGLTSEVLDRLPEGVRRHVDSALREARDGNWRAGMREMLEALRAGGGQVVQDAMVALSRRLEASGTSGAVRALLGNRELLGHLGNDKVREALDRLLDSWGGEAGNLPEALAALREAAASIPREVVERAVTQAAQALDPEGLSGVARDLLGDPAVVRELLTNDRLQEALAALANGDLSGLRELAQVPALRERIPQLLARSTALQQALGLSEQELRTAGRSIVDLADCFTQLSNNPFGGNAGEVLGRMLQLARDPALREIAQKAITHLAGHFAGGLRFGGGTGAGGFGSLDNPDPAGLVGLVTRALQSSELLTALAEDPELQRAVTQLAQGDLGGALRTVAGNERARNALTQAIASHPVFRQALERLGLRAEDLQQLGQALQAVPQLADALGSLARGDYRGALAGLRAALENPAAADLARRAVTALSDRWGQELVAWAQRLPEGNPIRALLSQRELVTSLVTDPRFAEALQLIGQGRIGEALGQIAATEGGQEILRRAGDALLALPQVRTALDRLGITAERLEQARPALPHLIRATEALAAGRGGEAVDHLLAAGAAAPDLVADAVGTMAQRWGTTQGVPAALQSLLRDRDLIRDIARSPAVRGAVRSLMEGNFSTDAVRALLADEAIGRRVIEALGRNESFRSLMQGLGLTPQNLLELRAAAPDLLQAMSAFGNNQFGQGVRSLVAAARNAPELVSRVFRERLPRVPLLHDQAFLERLAASPGARAAADAFARGELAEAFRALGNDRELRDAAIDALYRDGWGNVLRDRLGITADDLKRNADAIPHVMDAARHAFRGDYQSAVGSLVEAGRAAPDLVRATLGRIAARLPPAVRSLLTNPTLINRLMGSDELRRFISELVPPQGLTPHGIRAHLEQAVQGLLRAAPTIARDVAGALADDPNIRPALERLGLSRDDLLQCADAVPALISAAQALTSDPPDYRAALNSVRDALGHMPPALIARTVGRLAQNIPNLPSWVRSALGNEGLITRLAGSADFREAVRSLISGDAAGAMRIIGGSDELLRTTLDALFAHPQLGPRMRELGLTPERLMTARRALPHLVEAAESLLTNPQENWQQALGHLVSAVAEGGGALARDAITSAAQRIFRPGSLPHTILGDREFVGSLLDNPEYLRHFQSGDVGAGLRALMNNQQARDVVLRALGNSQAMQRAMQRFGLRPEDLRTLGLGAIQVFEAGEALARTPPDLREALRKITGLQEALRAQGVPAADISRLAGRLVSGLPVPQRIRDLVSAVAHVPGIMDELSGALQAIRDGRGDEFVRRIARVGRALPENTKVAFLNALGRLPRPVGSLFGNQNLNRAIVQTGTFDRFMNMAERIANGELGEAVAEMGSACRALLRAGNPIGIDFPWWLGGGRVELPFNDGAFEAIGNAFEGLIGAMPQYVQDRLRSEIQRAVVSSTIRNIPIVGNVAALISAVGSVVDLVNSDWSDPLDVLINLGQLGVDVAGVIPGGNNIGSAAGLVLRTARILRGVRTFIGSVDQFRRVLSGDFMAALGE